MSKLEINNTVFEFEHTGQSGVAWIRAGFFLESFFEISFKSHGDNSAWGWVSLDSFKLDVFQCSEQQFNLIKAWHEQQKAFFEERKKLSEVA